jgi:hypothetical protein
VAIVRVETLTVRDGPTNGEGWATLYETRDQRAGGQEFLLFMELDATNRRIPTRVRAWATGISGELNVVVPAGGTQRIPETGDIAGFRIDGGRQYYVELS